MSKLFMFFIKSFCIVLILGLIISSQIHAQNAVRIEVKEDILFDRIVNVSVTIDSLEDNLLIDGFTLLIKYGKTRLNFESVEPGTYFENCEWEYFNYSLIMDTVQYPGGPTEVGPYIKIEAKADLPGSFAVPSCSIDQPLELVNLIFKSTNDTSSACSGVAMQFVWTNCTDNSFSLLNSDTLLVSKTKLDDTCFTSSVVPVLVPAFRFYNGFTSMICSPTSSIATPNIYFRANSVITFDNTIGVKIKTNLSQEDSVKFAAFDFLISYDPSILTLLTVEPGDDLSECGWEYFNYRYSVLEGCESNCPTVIRIVSVAEINNSTNPTCFIDETATLVNLIFQSPSDITYNGEGTSINWIWNDCGDNTLSSMQGDTLFASQYVYDENFENITAFTSEFPTYFGAPSECNSGNTPTTGYTRNINFISTSIRGLFSGSIERGDINLNQIRNEIADYVLFTNYFIDGISVFINNPSKQSLASDVNGDGDELTLDDLVYLFRIIIGEVNPIPRVSSLESSPVLVIQDTIAKTISVEYADSLYGLYLIFDDYITPNFYQDSIIGRVSNETLFNKILIDPLWTNYVNGSPLISSGLLFSYTGDAHLMSVSASFDGVNSLSTSITGNSSYGCCQTRGNVDSDIGGGIDVSDLIVLVGYMFKNGPRPVCLEEADMNGSGSGVDISDLIYLIQYMFKQGDAPVPCF